MIKRVMIVLAIITVLGVLGHYEHHYTRECIVVSVDQEIVTVEDKQGHLWDFIGADYQENDRVIITMFDNHTHKIIDDEIIKVKPMA